MIIDAEAEATLLLANMLQQSRIDESDDHTDTAGVSKHW